MTVYLVAQINIEDRDGYARYEAGFGEPFAKYGGRMLSVSEEPHVLEGDWPYTRTVLVEFESQEAATTWYESPEYQAIIGHRQSASTANVVMVEEFQSSQA